MHITVAGKQVETGEALKTHVRDGLGAIAKKYFDHALEANVTFRRDAKGRLGAFNCDINLKAGRNLFVRGEGEGPDAHRAFEVAAEHVAKRLRRYRRKVNDHARGLAEERAGAAETAPQYVVSPADDENDEAAAAASAPNGADGHGGVEGHGAIVAEQPAEIARLSLSEAVMRLDLAQMPALPFRNSGSGAINLVYRRTDGCIGWIDLPPG
ncbi:ribosome-associated translation inhibitor RaiA [Craurococcus roseus]|uniref:Ribosome hibernation promoting factor n=1 Tax=Craurococcus roseus TaxID=77585 RepID=A0ABN1ET27_9PROT